jgi:hypothetical protein
MRLPFAHFVDYSVAVRATVGLALLAVILIRPHAPIVAEGSDLHPDPQRGTSSGPGPVTIDVRAVSGAGQPVTDLTTSDLTITLAGTVRAIQSMHLVVDTGSGRPASGAGGLPTPLPPPFATNAREGDGRTIYLLVDDESTDETGARVLASAVASFLDGLAPGDEVALATVGTPDTAVGPTVSRSRIEAAVGTIHGRAGPPETPAIAAARSRRCLLRLQTLLQDLGDSADAPIVVLLTGGLAASVLNSPLESGARMAPPTPGRATGTVTADALEPIRRAAALAHAVLDVVPLAPATPASGTAAGTSLLAAHLGMPAFSATASPETALARIARETTAHYAVVLAGEGVAPSTDPALLTVATTRPWLSVRATLWFAHPSLATPTIEALLASPDAIRALPIRTQTVLARGTSREAGRVAVTSFIGPVDGATRLVSVGSELLDTAGAVVAKDLPVSAPTAAPVAVSRLVAPPGHYRLRVAAIDAERRAGTVEQAIEVGLVPAGPLKLGSLAFGLPGPSLPVAPAPGRAGGRVELPPAPQPRFEFGPDSEALAFFELYGGVANEQVTVVMEVLRRPDGPPIQLLQPHIQAAAVGEPDHYRVSATVDLGDLSPGDYLVRATVSLGGQPPGILTRTLRKRGAGVAGGR